MITVRFRAEPNEADNLRVRFYTQDRATLLATVTSAPDPDNPITETIASSGSYECEVDLTGYWYVIADFVDTGEVTSDGFANQWVPEVLDTLSTSTTGSGLYLIAITVEDDSAAPVANATVTITNAAGTANVAWGTTDADGKVIFSLDAATYRVLVRGVSTAYASLAAQTLVVTAAASVTYTLTTQTIDPPEDPGLATVRFLVLAGATPVEGAKVTAELVEENPMVSTALIARSKLTGTTNASGYVDLTMIQAESFTRGGTYKIMVSDAAGRRLHERKVTVPSLASLYADALVDA